MAYQFIKCQTCHSVETSQFICRANRWTGFYVMATLALNQLISVFLSKDYQQIFTVNNRNTKRNTSILFSIASVAEFEQVNLCRISHTHTYLFLHNSRSSRPEVFCKKGVIRNSIKFTGNHLRQSLFFNKVAGQKRLCHRCFPVNFGKFLKTPLLTEHLRWLLLAFQSLFSLHSFRTSWSKQAQYLKFK